MNPDGERERPKSPRVTDRTWSVLDDPHRRIALRHLDEVDGSVSLESLAAAVAARTDAPSSEAAEAPEENGTPAGGSVSHERRLAIKLHHVHVPKLEDAGLVTRMSHGIVLTATGAQAVRLLRAAARPISHNGTTASSGDASPGR